MHSRWQMALVVAVCAAAFLAVGLAVWLLRVAFTTPAARPRMAITGWVLGVLIALQVTLGVEAWMGKFGDEARQGKSAGAWPRG